MAAFWREVWLLYVLVAHLLNKNFFVLPATPGLKHKRSNNNCCLLHEEMLYRTFHSNTLLCSALDLAPQHSIETAYLLTHFFPFFFCFVCFPCHQDIQDISHFSAASKSFGDRHPVVETLPAVKPSQDALQHNTAGQQTRQRGKRACSQFLGLISMILFTTKTWK